MEEFINDLDKKISKAETITGNLFDDLRDIRISFNRLKEAVNYSQCCETLPTKEEIISEGAKQINDWLEGNTEREKQHYLIGFRRSYEYVLRRLN
jgi:hypothetical protein